MPIVHRCIRIPNIVLSVRRCTSKISIVYQLYYLVLATCQSVQRMYRIYYGVHEIPHLAMFTCIYKFKGRSCSFALESIYSPLTKCDPFNHEDASTKDLTSPMISKLSTTRSPSRRYYIYIQVGGVRGKEPVLGCTGALRAYHCLCLQQCSQVKKI